MKRRIGLALTCSALTGGVLLCVLLGRRCSPPASEGVLNTPVTGGVQGDGMVSPAEGIPLKKEVDPIEQRPAGTRSEVEVAEPEQAPTQGSVPPEVELDFLPYPNEGETAFKHKYDGMGVVALGGAMLALRQRLNEEVDKLVEERIAQGLFDETLYPNSDAANGAEARHPLPQGMGEVWACERASLQPDGSLKQTVIVLTEAEHPVLFAHRSESIWVTHAYLHKQKKEKER